MNPLHFLDTNVLLYAAAGKVDDPQKYAIAHQLVSTGRFAISTQVLGEFYSVLRFNGHEKLSITESQEWVRRLAIYCHTDVDQDVIATAMFIKERFKIRFWDAALVSAATKLAIPTLYTEDLSHKQKYGTVTVINPFKANQ